MEARTIYVANTKTQKRYKISTNAQTLGELKQVLQSNGIDYTDMAFTEGITKTTLSGDNTMLPTEVPYGEGKTNNLVLLLTNNAKKIASGMDRKTVYANIKARNMAEAIKNHFGRNYTVVPTKDLEEFLASFTCSSAPTTKKEEKPALTGKVLETVDFDLEGLIAGAVQDSEDKEEISETEETLEIPLTQAEEEFAQDVKETIDKLRKSLDNAVEAYNHLAQLLGGEQDDNDEE